MVTCCVKIMIMYDIYITYFIDKTCSIAESGSAGASFSLFSVKRLFEGGKGGLK
jgi:hypothetical protein